VIRKMPVDSTPREGDVWGDPDLGFVGDIDGIMGKTGYGIHWKPLARTAEHWKKARVIESGSVTRLVAELDQRRPVIAWGIDQPAQELSWKTPKGRRVFALSEEHTRVVYGYEGDRKAPRGFHVMDTQHGPQFWKTDDFLKNWDSFGRKAIVLYP
jgi:N-acetylmuramoyl-L-alanine amidase